MASRIGLMASTAALGLVIAPAWPVWDTARAHPPAIVTGAAEKVMAEELVDFRKRLAEAIQHRDTTALGAFYADSFMHTDSIGAMQDKSARIAHVLSGASVIETAPTEELRLRVPNGWAGMATGLSALPGRVRWSAFYVRIGDGWQVAASQETRLP